MNPLLVTLLKGVPNVFRKVHSICNCRLFSRLQSSNWSNIEGAILSLNRQPVKFMPFHFFSQFDILEHSLDRKWRYFSQRRFSSFKYIHWVWCIFLSFWGNNFCSQSPGIFLYPNTPHRCLSDIKFFPNSFLRLKMLLDVDKIKL